jgi:hypothetical protein
MRKNSAIHKAIKQPIDHIQHINKFTLIIGYLKSRSSGAEMRALMRVRQATRSGSLFLMRRPCTIGWNRSRPFTSPAMVIASRV